MRTDFTVMPWLAKKMRARSAGVHAVRVVAGWVGSVGEDHADRHTNRTRWRCRVELDPAAFDWFGRRGWDDRREVELDPAAFDWFGRRGWDDRREVELDPAAFDWVRCDFVKRR